MGTVGPARCGVARVVRRHRRGRGGVPGAASPSEGGASDAAASSVVGALDALVLVGGGDIDPALYGQSPHPATAGVDPERDASELALLRAALGVGPPGAGHLPGNAAARRGPRGHPLPARARCRGARRASAGPGLFRRQSTSRPRRDRWWRRSWARRATVECSHHQAVDELGEGLVVTARSADGLAEAVELPSARFVVGVQWHPEEQGDERLFRALLEAVGVSPASVAASPAGHRPSREPRHRAHRGRGRPPGQGGGRRRSRAGRARAFPPGATWRRRTGRGFCVDSPNSVEAHAEELALLETRNVGKPIADSRGEVAMVADVLHFYSGAVDKHRGATIPVAGGVDLTWPEPLGVVAAIVPWNFPIAIASWKIAPALACGNTVVVKPAELTPLTALRLAELALDAGIPEGVLQVVVGRGTTVGTVLVEHPDVAKVAFTGLHRGRTRRHGPGVGNDQACHLGARGEVRQRRLRRRRSRARRGQRPARGVRQRRPGLLCPQPHPRRARCVRPFRGAPGGGHGVARRG